MTSQTPDWQAVIDRLEKLENQNRRLKQIGAVVLVLAVSFLLMGQAAPKKTVEANEFVLKDASGRVRGQLLMRLLGPDLTLFDENGTPLAGLGASAYGPGLYLNDEKGKTRALLGDDAGGPGLRSTIRTGSCEPRCTTGAWRFRTRKGFRPKLERRTLLPRERVKHTKPLLPL